MRVKCLQHPHYTWIIFTVTNNNVLATHLHVELNVMRHRSVTLC